MSDEQLSEIFKRDLPEDEQGQWADDARRRHRRRRGAIGGLAGGLALAVVAPFALNLGGGDGGTAVPVTVSTEPTLHQPPGGRDAACSGAAEAAVAQLPDSAERLWLCDEPGEVGFSRTGPQEPLTQGVDEALAAFHALEPADPNAACTMEYGMAYVVVAEGADGTLTPVSGGLHGCRMVGERSGADEFLATLGELWAAQRAAQEAPAVEFSVDQMCSTMGSILPVAIDDATQGALCAPDDYSGQPREGALLSADLVELVRTDIERGAVEAALGEWEPTATMVLGNAWGDSTMLTRFASGSYQWGGQVWRPNADLAAELDALLEMPAVPSAVDEMTTCDDARASFEGSPAAIDGSAVDGVWFCVENRAGQPRWAGPQSVLHEPEFVAQAVAAFNELPVLEAECEDTSRADLFVTYQGEQGVVASVKVTSCGPATGAVTKDGAEFVETLYEISRAQVGPSGAGMHFAGQVLCPQLDALVRFDPAAEGATQIVACVGDQGELPLDLGSDLVASIADEIIVAPGTADFEPDGGTLVWANRYGDPMTLIRAADGSFYWVDGEGTSQSWTPVGDVKDQLDRVFGL